MSRNSLAVFILISTLILISLYSCDPPCKDTQTIMPSQELKEYCIFKKNSFWIYKDSLSNITDTQKLVNAIWDTMGGDRHMCDILHTFTATVASSFYKDSIIYRTDQKNDGHQGSYQSGIKKSASFISPIKLNEKIMAGNYILYHVIAIKDSLSVAGTKYTDIVVVAVDKGLFSNKRTHMYWSRHFGIIKYLTSDGYVWELVKSQILQ